MARVTPLILCGGAGTRLWPASREAMPKQFMRLLGPRSTFQDTVARVADPGLFDEPVVITNAASTASWSPSSSPRSASRRDILLEPARRDSGPAIAAGARLRRSARPRRPRLVLAADHVVRRRPAFAAACQAARRAAEDGRIVTFGIEARPRRQPTTDISGPASDARQAGVLRVERLRREAGRRRAPPPTSPTAISGTRATSCSAPDVLLDEYQRFDARNCGRRAPRSKRATTDLGFVMLDADAFERAGDHLDRLRRDGEDRARSRSCRCRWAGPTSARGTRSGSSSDKDDDGNAVAGEGGERLRQARDNFVFSEQACVCLRRASTTSW